MVIVIGSDNFKINLIDIRIEFNNILINFFFKLKERRDKDKLEIDILIVIDCILEG